MNKPDNPKQILQMAKKVLSLSQMLVTPSAGSETLLSLKKIATAPA